jgi:hypothetical protein
VFTLKGGIMPDQIKKPTDGTSAVYAAALKTIDDLMTKESLNTQDKLALKNAREIVNQNFKPTLDSTSLSAMQTSAPAKVVAAASNVSHGSSKPR